jgi:hypothetical protein
VTTTDLTQLMTALTTLVAGLGGVMAFVGARLSKRQRELAEEVRDLRDYAALVTRWGFRVRVLLAANGLTAPPMPELGDEDDSQDPERDRVDRAPEAAPERPVSRLSQERTVGQLGAEVRVTRADPGHRADPRTAVAPEGGSQGAPPAVQQPPAAAATSRHRLREPEEDWPLPRERRTDWD